MNIRPSAAIRQNYNEIADLCRETAEPIFLTKNGEGDLVVMDIETYNRREKMLKLREELLSVEEDRMRGSEGYSTPHFWHRSTLQQQSGLQWNLKRLQNLWSRCRSAAHGSKANTFLKMLTDLSCLKNAICLSSRS